MPRGPRGEYRSADVLGCAVTVVRLSVGDMDEKLTKPFGKLRNGHVGAKVLAESLTDERRREVARKAAAGRWGA
jgi:hypothetical protein